MGSTPAPHWGAFFLRSTSGCLARSRAEREPVLGGPFWRHRDAEVRVDERGEVVRDGHAALLGGQRDAIGDLGGQSRHHQPPLTLAPPAAVAVSMSYRHA